MKYEKTNKGKLSGKPGTQKLGSKAAKELKSKEFNFCMAIYPGRDGHGADVISLEESDTSSADSNPSLKVYTAPLSGTFIVGNKTFTLKEGEEILVKDDQDVET